jgi:hypothetical protein
MQKSKNNLLQSLITSKIYIDSSIAYIDPSNFSSLLGTRYSLFSIINPFFLQYSLKTSFLFLESFLKKKYDFIFIADIKDPILFSKFQQICKKKHSLLKSSDVSSGFLTNKKLSKIIIVTLFLDYQKTELIQQESLIRNIPLISFSNLSVNRFSSLLHVGGNYTSFLAQNLVLTLLFVCLNQKHD